MKCLHGMEKQWCSQCNRPPSNLVTSAPAVATSIQVEKREVPTDTPVKASHEPKPRADYERWHSLIERALKLADGEAMIVQPDRGGPVTTFVNNCRSALCT